MSTPPQQPAADQRPVRVLVVDDSPTIQSSARDVLSAPGFELEEAADGFEALSKLADFEPDIMFIDVVMPRLDGYETIALLRVNPAFASLPIVMMSSKGGAFDLAKGKLVGCDDYIVKPFQQTEIIRIIDRYVGRTNGVATPA